MLYAERDFRGVINIMRKNKRCNWYDCGNLWIGSIEPSADHVFALTDNWSSSGKPCDWGIEPIYQRLKAIDLWSNESLWADLDKEHEEAEASRDRDRKNSMESFLYDFRDQFKKTFNDINTTNMVK